MLLGNLRRVGSHPPIIDVNQVVHVGSRSCSGTGSAPSNRFAAVAMLARMRSGWRRGPRLATYLRTYSVQWAVRELFTENSRAVGSGLVIHISLEVPRKVISQFVLEQRCPRGCPRHLSQGCSPGRSRGFSRGFFQGFSRCFFRGFFRGFFRCFFRGFSLCLLSSCFCFLHILFSRPFSFCFLSWFQFSFLIVISFGHLLFLLGLSHSYFPSFPRWFPSSCTIADLS